MAGLAAISGLFLVGLMGAPDKPPPPDARVDSGRVRTDVVVAADMLEVVDTVLTGEKCAIAEPGRAGRFLDAKALFCANIVSRRLGLPELMVLLENPRPGRGGPASVRLLFEFGLWGSF